MEKKQVDWECLAVELASRTLRKINEV